METTKPLTAKQKWPELQALAVYIANNACREIEAKAHFATAENMPYKLQCTLELLIDELQRRV